jgi:hypothetical protein
VWSEVLAAEPAPNRSIPSTHVDQVARVFADMVDLKSPFTLGHSVAVADLAVAAAGQLGFADDQVRTLRRAALLHDLGRVAVSGAVWAQPRALTTSEWEQVRLHPYHTERVLDRSRVLAPLAFHHYDIVYRVGLRSSGPPRWLQTVTGGWSVRLPLLAAAAAADLAGAAAIAMTLVLAPVLVGESVRSWLDVTRGEGRQGDT